LLASGPGNSGSETYAAAEAFSGEYRITVEKIWGKPLGNKVQLRIIRHQGTKDESEELITLKMHSTISEPITVKLDGGRRTEAAYVPPPAAHLALDEAAASTKSTEEAPDAVFNKLRALADPEVTGTERGRPQGGLHTPGKPVARPVPAAPKMNDKGKTLYQVRVSPLVTNSVDLTAQAVISADRRWVRLSISTVGTITTPGPAQVISTIFPGAGVRR
jgi:hypothetical protein